MKKIFLTAIAAAMAFAFTACSEEGTNVKWKTASTYDPSNGTASDSGIYDIKWEHDGNTDTSWSGEQLIDPDQSTSSKTVGELTGSGSCLYEGGDEATIEIDDSSTGVAIPGTGTVTLAENTDATLIIATPPAKK